MDVADGSVVQDNPIVQLNVAALPDRLLNYARVGGTVLGMHATQNEFESYLRFWIESEDAVTLAAEVDIASRHTPGAASGVAQPLPFHQVGFTSFERLCGPLRLRNVAIDRVDLSRFSVDPYGRRHKRHRQPGTILTPAHHFGIDTFPAFHSLSQAVTLVPQFFGHNQLSNIPPQRLLGGEAEEFDELFVYPQHPVVCIPDDDCLRRQLEQPLEMCRPFAQFVLGSLLLGVSGRVVDTQRDLFGYQRQEANLFGAVSILVRDGKTQAAKSSVCSCERKDASRPDAVLPVNFHQPGKAGFLISGSHHDGLLVVIDPPCNRFLGRKVWGNCKTGRFIRMQNRVLKSVGGFVVEEKSDEIEVGGLTQFSRQHAKQLLRVAVYMNCPRNSDERFISEQERMLRPRRHSFVHPRHHSHPLTCPNSLSQFSCRRTPPSTTILALPRFRTPSAISQRQAPRKPEIVWECIGVEHAAGKELSRFLTLRITNSEGGG